MQELLAFVGGVSLLIGGFFAAQKAYGWLWPLRIRSSVNMDFQDSANDAIYVRITNVSTEALYVTACKARSSYPLIFVLKQFIGNPFIKPRLYQVLRFGAFNYDLLGKEPLKLESMQPKELKCNPDWSFPISGFDTSHFIVEVELSSGRKVRSHSLRVPARWHISRPRNSAQGR